MSVKFRHQKQSLDPHPIKLALPALHNPSAILQRKIQRNSSFASSEALLDEFQKVLANTSQRILNGGGSSVVKDQRENEPKRKNDKILILMRNELKEVLKNSPERKFFEEAKNNNKHERSRSISRLREELNNQTFEKSPEPYLQGLIEEENSNIQPEKKLPNLLRSSGALQLKRSIIPYQKPVRVFHNEEIHKQLFQNYYLKNTITEMDTDSDSSILGVLSPIEKRLWERSGSSRVNMENLQQRCLTEPNESPAKQNSVRLQRQNGLFVLGNKSVQIAKTLNKTKSFIIETKKNNQMRTQASEDYIGIKRVRAKSIPSAVFFK